MTSSSLIASDGVTSGKDTRMTPHSPHDEVCLGWICRLRVNALGFDLCFSAASLEQA